ncbi:uncharacterized protein [Aegilops tauschii subsp. strangulata]|uniref:uncharacterized protein n=1 Tax=Aegilops tauschii subsp. strangulata TaxID=200361 RepID=UPI003CC8A2B9
MDTKMEIHSGASCTKRARLAPPATASSGGLEVAVGSGEEEQSGPDRISDLPDAILGEVIYRLSNREGIRTQSILSSHVGAVLRLCISACYLQCRPSTVHAWLESPRLNNLQIPDHYVEVLELPLVKRLLLVEVDISDFSLQSMIKSSCPTLECLLLVCNRERHRIKINSPNLVSIGMRGEKGEFIIEDAPSLQRLIHDILSNNMEVFIASAPKLKTLGKFRISLGSTGLMGLATVSLSTMRQSVKTLFLAMSYEVDLVIHLLTCLPNLENLFVEVMILTPNEKLISEDSFLMVQEIFGVTSTMHFSKNTSFI